MCLGQESQATLSLQLRNTAAFFSKAAGGAVIGGRGCGGCGCGLLGAFSGGRVCGLLLDCTVAAAATAGSSPAAAAAAEAELESVQTSHMQVSKSLRM